MPETAIACNSCGQTVEKQGQCTHCDHGCESFPYCILCAMMMEPDKIGEGISLTAEAVFWRQADEIPNQWWESSEFGMKK